MNISDQDYLPLPVTEREYMILTTVDDVLIKEPSKVAVGGIWQDVDHQ